MFCLWSLVYCIGYRVYIDDGLSEGVFGCSGWWVAACIGHWVSLCTQVPIYICRFLCNTIATKLQIAFVRRCRSAINSYRFSETGRGFGRRRYFGYDEGL